MVLYKYCPKCYSLNVNYDRMTGDYKCVVCGYLGPVNQDSIDKINILKKTKDTQKYAAATSATKPTLENSSEAKEFYEKDNKKTFVKPKDTIPLKEKVKGKGGSDWDFL